MLRLLNFRVLLMSALFITTIFVNDAKSQVTEIDYQIRYNDQDCLWDFYIIIVAGNATTVPTRAQFNAQYTFVVPTGTTVSSPIGNLPIQNNQAYTGTDPTEWSYGAPAINPGAFPGFDFYPVAPKLAPASFFNNLTEGDTAKIFSVNMSIIPNCGEGIRVFDNDTDPNSSADGFGGGNFSNGYTLGSPTQLYDSNEPTIVPPAPVVSAMNMCETGIRIDLTASTSTCQEPLTYSWDGPGFSSTDEDVDLPMATFSDAGTYTVTVTDDFGCETILAVEGELKPDAGAALTGCVNSTSNLQGTPNTGTWSEDITNSEGGTLNSGANGAATVDFSSTALGNYTYIYTGMECSDSVVVSIVSPDAGPNPADLTCFSSGTVTLSAVGTGTWSIGAGSAGTAVIFDASSANTTVDDFSVSGIYFLVWEIGACSDTVTVVTNENCDCAISNNSLTPISPNSFCGTSGNVTINGGAVSVSGVYAWEYSLGAGAFSSAPGTNNTEDYTTDDLADGSHSFRRLYTTDTGVICSDTSNIVSFIVTDDPLAPENLVATPQELCEDETTTVSVDEVAGAVYTWTVTPVGSGAFIGTSSFITLDPFLPGVYTVTVFATLNGCPSPTSTIDVTVNELPPTPNPNDISSTDPTFCEATDGTITIVGYDANATYTVSYDLIGVTLFPSIVSDGSGSLVITNLGAGSYTNFQIISEQGCISGIEPGPVVLSDPEAPGYPTGLMASPNPECLGLPITISVDDVPGATYEWSASSPNAGLGNSTTNSVQMSATAAGLYSIFVNLTIAGCTSIDTFTSIQVNDAPPTPDAGTVSSIDPGACGAADGSISLSGYAASTAYDVTFSTDGVPSTVSLNSNASGVLIINGLTEGTYSDFSVTNFTGCSSGVYPGPVSLADPGSPNAPANLIASPNPVCLGNSVAILVDNTIGATFNWSASSPDAGLGTSSGNSISMNPTATGTYTISVSITVAGCTSMSSSIDVVVGDTPPTPSGVTGTDPTECAGTDGFITLPGYIPGNIYTLDYSANGTPVLTSITANGSGEIVVTGLSAGNYSDFVVTNAASCPSDNFAGPINLIDPSAPDAPIGLIPSNICEGETATITADLIAGATYSWSVNPADAGFNPNNTNEITFTPTTDGAFSVSVNLTLAGCTSASSTPVNVNVTPSPDTPIEANIIATNPTACLASDGTISISGLVASVSYGVQLDSASITINKVISANSSGALIIGGLSSGAYTNIILTNELGCSSGTFSGPIVLSDPGAPDAPEGLVADPDPSCLGTLVNLSVTNNPGATYIWSANSPDAGLVQTNGNTTTMTATMAGVYTVFLSQTVAGCTSPAAMIDVTVSGIPPTPDDQTVIGVNPTDCGVANGTITVNGLSVSTTYDLTYSTNGTLSTTSFTSNASGEIVITGLTAGDYTDFSLMNAQGCASGVFPGPISLIEPAAPGAPIAIGTDPSACGVVDGSILVSNLEVSANISLTYSYNGTSTTGTFTTNASGEINLTGLAPGDYTGFSYMNNVGCTSEVLLGPISLIEPTAPPAPTAVGTNPSDCGVANGSILVSGFIPSTSNELTYSFNGTAMSTTLMSDGSGDITLSDLATGNYTEFSYVSASGCISGVFPGPIVLIDPAAPGAPTGVGTNPTDCGVPNGSILVSGLDPSASISLTYSYNGTATTATLMTDGSGNITLANLAAGNYSDFSYVSVSGCTSEVFLGPVTLSEPNAPGAPTGLMANPNPVCLGETVNLSVDNISGAIYNWTAASSDAGLVTTAGNTTTMIATAAGTYSISVTLSIGGCQSPPISINVVINPLPPTPLDGNITSTNPTSCTVDDGSISVSGYVPSTDYELSYSYNSGLPGIFNVTTDVSGTIVLNNLVAGSYTEFTLTDSNGCTSGTFAGAVTLTQPGAPDAPSSIDGVPNPVCLGNQVALSVDANPSATFQWMVSTPTAGLMAGSGNTATMDPTAAGIITVSVTQTIAGCVSSPALISILVLENCLNPDFGVTYNGIDLEGDLGTNDDIVSGTIYSDPQPIGTNPTATLPSVTTTGLYTFSTMETGEWYFTVEVCNSSLTNGCARIPLAITVLDFDSTENPPVGNHDYIHSLRNTDIPITVITNDKCQSFPNCEITITSIEQGPFFGSYNTTSQIYTPDNNFVGRDSFLYEICQTPITPQSCDQEWAYIEIFPGFATHFTNGMDDYNQTPLNTVLNTIAENGLMANDSDASNESQVVTPVSMSVTGKGSIVINADGSYVFTPETGFIGPVDFPYTTCRVNDNSVCDNATLHLLVEPMAAAGIVGSCVWEDTNGNGIFEPGEPPVAGVPVSIYTESGVFVRETVTDASGNYQFDDILQGFYFLQFETIGAYEFTIPNVGSDLNDSDVDDTNGPGTTTQFTLLAGQSIENFKAGLFECTRIGDNIWYDVNENDVYDSTENGINGMKIFLWRNVNGQWIVWDETTSGKKPKSPSDDGWWEFCTSPGEYYIQIILPPTGLVQAVPFVGNNPFKDSDINNANGPGTTNSFVLENGVDKLDIGAGYYPQAVVGNLVWFDENFDGLQNDDEPRIAGVLVEIFDVTTSAIIGQSITNDEGIYMIDSLDKRDVYFKFTPPSDMVATVADVGNDQIDSDVDHTYGLNTTRMISLKPNTTNNQIDFGLSFGALPVKWLSVNVTERDDIHHLVWKVEQEVNVEEYVVLRRHESEEEFTRVNSTTIKANDVLKISEYSFGDSDIKVPGFYYYKLQQFDYDGKFNFSKSVSIDRDVTLLTSLYPNPTTSMSTLAFETINDGDVKVTVIDISGKVVIELNREVEEGPNSIVIDMTDLLPGAYNVKVQFDGQVSNKRLIKVK
jgi:hypothetical protein